MSHMKTEPCNTDREEGPPGDLNSQSFAMIDKQEESDLDMDDVITEAPTSPQNLSPSITPPPLEHDQQQQQQMDKEVIVATKRALKKEKEKEKEQAQIQSLKIKRTSDLSSYRIVTNDKTKRNIQARPKTPMNFKKDPSPTPNERSSRKAKRPNSKELNALLNYDHSKQAGRISKRRSTMANHCHELDTSARPGKKRRLSCSGKNSDNTENNGIKLRTRNSSGSGGGGNDTSSTTTSKRMRLDQTPVKSGGDANVTAQMLNTTPKRSDTIKSTQVNSNSLSSNIVPASAVDMTVTAMVTISTPRTNNSTNRREKSKAAAATATATTPRITQFFTTKTPTPVKATNTNATATPNSIPSSTPASAPAPTPSSASSTLLCDKCSIILSSVNELNFHKKSHELQRCIKCKKSIDTAENPISNHVVSCFLLDNKISNDLLTRFLKVKVDLDRLTPIKIKQIQENLQSNEGNVGSSVRHGSTNSRNRESIAKEPSNRVNRRQSKEKSRRESTPSAIENSQNSINDKSVEGKNDQDRNGSKKSKNKKYNANKSSTAKNLQNDFSDDLMITENTSATLNWNDEPNKDKIFSQRNFECDTSIYVNIKEVLNTGTPETQHKVANFVKRISLLKQKDTAPPQQRTILPVVNPQNPHVPAPAQAPSPIAATAVSAAPVSAAPTPQSSCVVNGFTHGPFAQNQSVNPVRQLSTMHTPAQIQSLQSALARHNITNTIHSPMLQNALKAPSPYTAVSSHALHATQSPQVACAPQATPLANVQPISYVPATSSASNALNASNTPNGPQLLDLPQRVRLRNRAYSIHFEPIEQIPTQIIARRQSFGNGLLTPISSHAIQTIQTAAPAAASAINATIATLSTATAAQQPDHTYTRSTLANSPNYYPQNGQRPTPPPPPPPPQYMTQIHARDIAMKNCATPNPPTQLKVLTPDDLNSRAANAAQPIQSAVNNRTDSPNSTENNSNLNNNNQSSTVKRVRTKMTPMRNGGVHISDDANITISVSLTKLGSDQAELSLTTEQHGKISYDALTDKRKQEVQSSLLKDDVWLKMLKHLKTIRPTNDTMVLFKQILPVQQHNTFMTELRKIYGSRI